MKRALLTAVAFALTFSSPAFADGKTKEFPAQKCKVTLPGEEWRWVDDPAGGGLATATTGEGLVLTVTALPAPKEFAVRSSFAKGFDEGFFKDGTFEKRAGKLTKFRGAPCYQALFRVAEDKRTGALRVFIRDGYCYQLQLIGTTKPVEKRRDFEKIMQSFDFLAAAP